MQAQLDQAEFAYLLHTMGAKAVVGVNNRQFFPEEQATRDSLLSTGFARLKENGWLVPTDEGIQSNGRLLLLSAIIASPSLVITVTQLSEGNQRQTINYYQAGNLIVEQFEAANGRYAVAQLPKTADLPNRIAIAFGLPDTTDAQPLTFVAKTFEPALKAARGGNHAPLQTAFAGEGRLADEQLATIASLRPAGRVEAAAVAGTRLLAQDELGLLRDENGRFWVALRDADEQLTLQQLDLISFATLLSEQLARLNELRQSVQASAN